MKILFDINHPHQVHFFKNAILSLQIKGHEVLISSSEKDISLYLLDYYKLEYIKAGKSVGGLTSKAYELLKKEWKLLKIVKDFNPDLLVSLTSPALSHISKLIGKKHLAFADTEHANIVFKLTIPFTDVIYTPTCFQKNLGKKHFRYNGYQELAYLHPKYFQPNPSALDKLNLTPDDKFIVLRFVAWTAHHDVGHTGIDIQMKWQLIKELENFGRVLITSEVPLPSEFEPYRITVAPEMMHDILYYATILIGESATMASECAVLGTPAIFIDYAGRGYTDEEEKKYGLVFNFKDDRKSQEKALIKAIELLKNENLKDECRLKRKKLLEEKIDVTKFIVDSIENCFE